MLLCLSTCLYNDNVLCTISRSRPQQPVDLALCRTLGLDCASKRWICVKSAGHFRSGFGPIAANTAAIYNVDGSSGATILSHNYAEMASGFTRLGRPVHPVHRDATFDPGAEPQSRL
eukprot:SAG22_NODE_304_length_12712_cov_10.515421_6_plen_117_part_00